MWLYSLQMAAMTLVPAALGLLGGLYVLLALVLGAYFLRLVWGPRRTAERALARRVYKFSQVYLALVMLAMVGDRLL